MKTDLNSIKAELKRLADVDTLKKELNKLATDIKNFDLSQSLTPQAKARVQKLEKRFKVLKATLQELQTKADAAFEKFATLVGRSKKTSQTAKAARSSAKKAPRKPKAAGSKKAAGSTKKAASKRKASAQA